MVWFVYNNYDQFIAVSYFTFLESVGFMILSERKKKDMVPNYFYLTDYFLIIYHRIKCR